MSKVLRVKNTAGVDHDEQFAFNPFLKLLLSIFGDKKI